MKFSLGSIFVTPFNMHKTIITTSSSFFTLLFAVLLCSNAFGQKTPKRYPTDCTALNMGEYFIADAYEHEGNYLIYADMALVYCSPENNALVLDSLSFNTMVKVNERIKSSQLDTIFQTEIGNGKKTILDIFHKEVGEWYRIEHEKRGAYIKKEDVAIWNIPGFLAGRKRIENFDTIELSSIDSTDEHKSDKRFLFDYLSHGFELEAVNFNGLKDCEVLIHYRTYRESCPGGEMHQFVAFTNDGFKEVASCSGEGEGGEYIWETVYLPMRFPNGKVLLVAYADIENIFNIETAELNTYPYPEKLGVPIDQLIVKTNEFTVPLLDEEGNDQYDEYEMRRVRVDHDPPIYYRWNGKEVGEVK
ncbi:MAG: hypothetical protein ACKVOR_08485 [Flavobacteriales bacterium]